ncbi:hypothetical protein C8R44DRAFT_895170 [Mycena epipterygia]|nr:hypothetical protein C8R44DRAFT_895170 [Mycena epipterygia]
MLKKTRRILGASRTRVISTACSASDSWARRTYEDWYDHSRVPTYCGPDTAHDYSRLCAARMAHEATHHAAASTPASLRHIHAHHRKKADGSASRTHPGQVGSETTTDVRKLSRTRVRFHIHPKSEYSPHAECMHHSNASLPRRTPPRALRLTQHLVGLPARWCAKRRCDLPVHPRIRHPRGTSPSPLHVCSREHRPSAPQPRESIPCTTLSSEASTCGVPAHNETRTRGSPRAYVPQIVHFPTLVGVPSAHESPRVTRTPWTGTRGTQPGRLVLPRPARTVSVHTAALAPRMRMHRPQQSRRPPLRACTPSICARIFLLSPHQPPAALPQTNPPINASQHLSAFILFYADIARLAAPPNSARTQAPRPAHAAFSRHSTTPMLEFDSTSIRACHGVHSLHKSEK